MEDYMAEKKQDRNNEKHEEDGRKETPRPFTRDWFKLIGLVVKQSTKDFFNDSGPHWAAALTYYALLSSIPLILAIVAITSFFVEEEWAIQQVGEVLGDFLPEGEDQVEEIVEEAMAAQGTVSLLSIGFLLWSGSRVFGVLARALNIFYDVEEFYSLLKRTLVELIMLLSIGVLVVLALFSRVIMDFLLPEFDFLPFDFITLENLITNVVASLLIFISILLIYRYVPRRRVAWRAAVAGAAVTTILFSLGRPIFWYWVNTFAEYHQVYGSMAAVVVIVLWAYIVSLFLLIGGELTSHIQEMVIEGKPAEKVEERHLMRSPFHKDEDETGDGDSKLEQVENRVKEKAGNVKDWIDEKTGNSGDGDGSGDSQDS
jgi:membrane protein